jgi:hypothetical protein
MLNITLIPADRVPFIDPTTGLVSRAWYRFLLSLFDLTGGGSNPISLTDLMVGPTAATAESQIAEIQKAIQGLALTPLAPSISDTLTVVLKRLEDVEVGPSLSGLVSDIANLQQQIQSLSLNPPVIPNINTGTVTSVDVSGGTTGLTFSGGPVTTAGTITMAGTLAAASGGTGASSLTGAGIVTITDTQTITGVKAFSNANNTFYGLTYATSDGGTGSNAYFGENLAYAVIGGVNGVVLADGGTYPGTGRYVADPNTFRPFADNSYALGTASFRYTVVYATTGTINTSDATQKQQVRELNDAERRVAKTIKGLIRAFKWNEAVESKGDGARIHIGVMAQEVAAAFAAEGLDATKYGLFCQDTWTTLDGSQTRFGVRYEELLAFVIAAL